MIVRCLAITSIGFISGSMMYSYLIPKYLKNIDVREASEDGNPGSSNAIRAAGPAIGISCMLLDVLKAFVPVLFAVKFGGIKDAFLIPVIIAPVLGHAFSPFMKFKGGKSISTMFGALLGVFPLSKIVLLPAATFVFFKFVAVVRPDSAAVTCGMVSAAILVFFFEPEIYLKIAFFALSVLLIYKLQLHPDKGEQSLKFLRYTYTFQDNRIKVHKF